MADSLRGAYRRAPIHVQKALLGAPQDRSAAAKRAAVAITTHLLFFAVTASAHIPFYEPQALLEDGDDWSLEQPFEVPLGAGMLEEVREATGVLRICPLPFDPSKASRQVCPVSVQANLGWGDGAWQCRGGGGAGTVVVTALI